MLKYEHIINEHLDKSYYTEKYTLERINLHDTIISRHFIGKEKKSKQQMIFMGGCFGAGKTTILNKLFDSVIDSTKYIHIDQDIIRTYLPEYSTYEYTNIIANTYKESNYLAELIQKYSLLDGYSIILDGTLKYTHHVINNIKWINSMCPSCEIIIIFVHANLDTLIKRNDERKVKKERHAEDSVIHEVYGHTMNTYNKLSEAIEKVHFISTDKIIDKDDSEDIYYKETFEKLKICIVDE